ncbi:MAG: hypothetical protein ACK56F_13925, partial [bacterium]
MLEDFGQVGAGDDAEMDTGLFHLRQSVDHVLRYGRARNRQSLVHIKKCDSTFGVHLNFCYS